MCALEPWRFCYGVSMREDETEMMVRRHIRDGASHIAKQRALIVRLRQKGLPAEEAEALLVTFEDMQRQHEDHLARVEASGKAGPLGGVNTRG